MRLAKPTANNLRASAVILLSAWLGATSCNGKHSESRSPETAAPAPPAPAPKTPADAASTSAPNTMEKALALAREKGFGEVASVIEERVEQRSPKMKLTNAQGIQAAVFAVQHLTALPRLRALHEVMPHSTVELVRAIEDRGVAAEEVERIADLLLALVAHLDFARLDRFDKNHSHVTGREWREIDYTGEKMTWQGQKKYWSKKGVPSFKKAEHIHRYFAHAYELPHFARVYRPRAKWAGFSWP